MNDKLLWFSPKMIVPPWINCMHHLLQVTYDPKTDQAHNLPGVEYIIHDFGGISTIDYVAKSKIGNFKYYDCFKSLTDYYLKRDYSVKENFFATPYDWRIGPHFLYDFWIQYRKIIEEAYEKSNGRKVTLLGVSMGCFLIQQFFTADKTFSMNDGLYHSIRDKNLIVNETWKQKYIEKVVFIAPSFGGSFTYFESMINRVSLLFPFLRNEHISDMSSSFPCFHSHHPDYEIFKYKEKNYTIKELDEVILKYSNIKKSFIPSLNISLDLQRKAPMDIGENIPLAIIYNSGVKTLSFLHFKDGWNNYPTKYYEGKGDGTLTVDSLLFPCENCSVENRCLVCIDLNKSDEKNFKHSALQSNPLVLDILYNLTSKDASNENLWWMKNGRHNFIFANLFIYLI